MAKKIVSQLDVLGYLIGSAEADEDQRQKERWLLPALCVDLPPPDVPDGLRARYVGSEFVFEAMPAEPLPPEPTLDELKTARISGLSADCGAQIVAGFLSSALGAQHTYPAGSLDQINLTASVVASLLPGLPAGWTTPFWCADAEGNWTLAAHTEAQIQKVGADGKAAILTAIEKNTMLAAQVMAATTAADVDAIVWDQATP